MQKIKLLLLILTIPILLIAQDSKKQEAIKKKKAETSNSDSKELPTKVVQKKEKKENIRVEIDIDRGNSDEYNTITVGQFGLITFFETDEKENKESRLWQIDKYSTGLKLDWSKKEGVSRNLNYVKHFQKDNLLYLLFAQPSLSVFSTSPIYKQEYEIVTIDVKTGDIKSTNQPLTIAASIEDFIVENNTAFIAGKLGPSKNFKRKKCCIMIATCGWAALCKSLRFAKTDGYLLTLNLSSSKTNLEVINTGEKSDSKIVSLSVDSKTHIINALTYGLQKETGLQLFIRQYESSGVLKNILKIDGGNEYELYSGEITNTASNEMLIVGTFGKRSLMNTGLGEHQVASSGLYICKMINNSQKYIKFYPFANFKNFFGYLGEKTEQKVEAKIEKRKDKGKEVNVSYRLLSHEIIVKNNQYYFIGECFYPEYHTEVYYTTDANGRTVRQTRRVFDGYRYTHAIATKFDNDGKMLWDASFPIWDILTFTLKERIAVLTDRTALTLVYSQGGYLKSKVVDQNNLKDGSLNIPLELPSQDDNLRSSWGSDINYWYDNCFIAWGYQKIKNTKDDNVKRKRNVFYLNKVYFE